MSEQMKFWKPEPREPWRDWRTWGMFLPLMASMLGFAFTGLFAFAFSDIGVIRPEVQSWMVIIGSALIVWGAEANTPFTVIEVYRKILRQEANGWDYSALIASLTGTAINLLVTFASRQVAFGDSAWRQWAMSWGPLISGLAVTLDYYGGMIELGFLFGSHEARSDQWREEREEWRVQNGQGLEQVSYTLKQQVADLDRCVNALVDRWTWPTAKAEDVKRATDHLNGDRANLTRQELGLILAEHKLNLPSPSTVKRGLGG